ncbi:MAG: hypothetical protein ABGX07_07810 [Pirellulaceae bacterium]|nr:hypothetical protein [Planctomycetota bacterium]
MAKNAVSSNDNGNRNRNFGALDAILFRAGRYEDVISRLNETIDSWGETLPTSIVSGLHLVLLGQSL